MTKWWDAHRPFHSQIAKAIPQSLISNLERLYSDSTLHHDGVEATFHVLSHLIEIRPEWAFHGRFIIV